MLSLSEWLMRTGFKANPFAHKQADEEGEKLQEYFVEHYAYNCILDASFPRSTILHAPRGAGKSAARRMFEMYWMEQDTRPRPLMVHFFDWMSVIEKVSLSGLERFSARPHIDELLKQVVVALAQEAVRLNFVKATIVDEDMSFYLKRLFQNYRNHLKLPQQRALIQSGWLSEEPQELWKDDSINTLSLSNQGHMLVQIIQSLGYHTCYVLVDGIDELAETVNDWESAADLLTPLICNLPLIEIPGLAFKYFIPSEVIEVLRHRNTLREDRIGCFSVRWKPDLLQELLGNRLRAFSQGKIESLASLSLDIRDIDEQLCAVSDGSPRNLLKLCETVIQTCTQEATDDDLMIHPRHLKAVLVMQDASVVNQVLQASVGDNETSIPLLSIHRDGRICRGDTAIEGWEKIPLLQRRFLEYLYHNQGAYCHQQAIFDYVYQGKPQPNHPDSFPKLARRLSKFVEPDPSNPVYIKRCRGGYYLENAAYTGNSEA